MYNASSPGAIFDASWRAGHFSTPQEVNQRFETPTFQPSMCLDIPLDVPLDVRLDAANGFLCKRLYLDWVGTAQMSMVAWFWLEALYFSEYIVHRLFEDNQPSCQLLHFFSTFPSLLLSSSPSPPLRPHPHPHPPRLDPPHLHFLSTLTDPFQPFRVHPHSPHHTHPSSTQRTNAHSPKPLNP